MTVMTREKVLDKIRKLVALSGSSNIHEAEVAAAAAQRLMLEHRVSESEITVDSREEDVVVDREVYRDLGLKAPPRWHAILLHGVAEANFCCLVSGQESVMLGMYEIDTRRVYHLIGTERDRSTAVYLYQMLRFEIERLCDHHAYRLGYDRADRASFKLGAACAIADKLRAEFHQFRARAASTGNAQALAVIDRTGEAVARFTRQAFPHLQQRSGPRASRGRAFHEGRAAGGAIDVGARNAALGRGQKRLPGG
jgi:hypothetical protein